MGQKHGDAAAGQKPKSQRWYDMNAHTAPTTQIAEEFEELAEYLDDAADLADADNEPGAWFYVNHERAECMREAAKALRGTPTPVSFEGRDYTERYEEEIATLAEALADPNLNASRLWDSVNTYEMSPPAPHPADSGVSAWHYINLLVKAVETAAETDWDEVERKRAEVAAKQAALEALLDQAELVDLDTLPNGTALVIAERVYSRDDGLLALADMGGRLVKFRVAGRPYCNSYGEVVGAKDFRNVVVTNGEVVPGAVV